MIETRLNFNVNQFKMWPLGQQTFFIKLQQTHFPSSINTSTLHPTTRHSPDINLPLIILRHKQPTTVIASATCSQLLELFAQIRPECCFVTLRCSCSSPSMLLNFPISSLCHHHATSFHTPQPIRCHNQPQYVGTRCPHRLITLFHLFFFFIKCFSHFYNDFFILSIRCHARIVAVVWANKI